MIFIVVVILAVVLLIPVIAAGIGCICYMYCNESPAKHSHNLGKPPFLSHVILYSLCEECMCFSFLTHCMFCYIDLFLEKDGPNLV